MQAPDAVCCCLSLIFQGQWRLLPIRCQWEAGSNLCPVRTTLLSCWSMSLLVCCSEASPSPGGSLPFTFSQTRHWQHNSVMNFTWSSTNLTRNTEKHLYPWCYNKFSVMQLTWLQSKTLEFKRDCEYVGLFRAESPPPTCISVEGILTYYCKCNHVLLVIMLYSLRSSCKCVNVSIFYFVQRVL